MSQPVHPQKQIFRVGLRSDRIVDEKVLFRLHEQVREMCDAIGQRQAALLMKFPVSKLNHIYNGKWKNIAVYPETKMAIEVTHDIVMRHRKMSNEAREYSEQVSAYVADFVKAASNLRRALRRL